MFFIESLPYLHLAFSLPKNMKTPMAAACAQRSDVILGLLLSYFITPMHGPLPNTTCGGIPTTSFLSSYFHLPLILPYSLS